MLSLSYLLKIRHKKRHTVLPMCQSVDIHS